jgi:hypothetical protein
MTSSTKLDEKLEGARNFRAWKCRVMLIKNLIKAKMIIVDSIKDHLIPHVSSLDTHPKGDVPLQIIYKIMITIINNY